MSQGIQRSTVEITSANVAGSEKETEELTGFIHKITYVKQTEGDAFADAVNFDIVSDICGETILDVDGITTTTTWYPRPILQTSAAVDYLYETGEEVPSNDGYSLYREKLKLGVAGTPGTTRRGTFHIDMRV